MQKKQNSEVTYKILKPFVLLKFVSKYHPIVIGKENIPLRGPIIICGNHRHVDDQYNYMMVTKRVIHYMAKDEYFKGKKEWFYRAAGCIPVDRSIHDENAKSEAKTLLEHRGALGIFPEGTRNEVTCKQEKLDEMYEILKDKMSKEELISLISDKSIRYTQTELLIKLNNENKITKEELKNNILDPDKYLKELLEKNIITKDEYENSLLIPFKFGAVSLANKTNALIVPCGTRGLYDGNKNQLITKIGKPISVKGMSLDEANELLRKNIIDLMQN